MAKKEENNTIFFVLQIRKFTLRQKYQTTAINGQSRKIKYTCSIY